MYTRLYYLTDCLYTSKCGYYYVQCVKNVYKSYVVMLYLMHQLMLITLNRVWTLRIAPNSYGTSTI